MALDFDELPYYEPITNQGDALNPIWMTSFGTMFTRLISYLTSAGIFIPQITTAQRDNLSSPQNGQMIYNTTTEAPQIYQNGAWKTFTTT